MITILIIFNVSLAIIHAKLVKILIYHVKIAQIFLSIRETDIQMQMVHVNAQKVILIIIQIIFSVSNVTIAVKVASHRIYPALIAPIIQTIIEMSRWILQMDNATVQKDIMMTILIIFNVNLAIIAANLALSLIYHAQLVLIT